MEYTLSLGGISALATSSGAELVSLRDAEGTEYIWQGNPEFWSGRNPNLFPVIGAVRPEGIIYEGKTYPTTRHGFIREAEFSLAEKTESSICFELRESPRTLALYPYPFRLRIRHSLSESGFTTSYEVLNTGDGDMYYCVGGHTAFNCPLPGEGDFSDWRIEFDKEENPEASIPLPGGFISFEKTMPAVVDGRFIPLDHAVFDKIDTLIFKDLNSDTVRLLSPSGKGIRFDFADFPIIAFWTAPGKNASYICLEPWQGCGALEGESGRIEDKPHAVRLAPGESKCHSYTVSIIR